MKAALQHELDSPRLSPVALSAKLIGFGPVALAVGLALDRPEAVVQHPLLSQHRYWRRRAELGLRGPCREVGVLRFFEVAVQTGLDRAAKTRLVLAGTRTA